jgi:hypothetical protein
MITRTRPMNLEYINLFTLTHFILWFMIGIMYPSYYKLAFLLSIIWELAEEYFVQTPSLYLFLKKNWFVPEKYWNEGIGNKLIDIVTNMAAYYIGSNIVKNKWIFFVTGTTLWIIILLFVSNER